MQEDQADFFDIDLPSDLRMRLETIAREQEMTIADLISRIVCDGLVRMEQAVCHLRDSTSALAPPESASAGSMAVNDVNRPPLSQA